MLDRNTLIGLVLIFGVFIGYGILSAPSEEEKAAIKAKQDSIIKVETQKKIIQVKDSIAQITNDTVETLDQDSINLSAFGAFASCSQGTNNTVKVSNELFEVDFSTLGALVKQVTLKNYTTYGKKPVKLFDKNAYGLNLTVGQNIVRTENLYFEPTIDNKPITKPIEVKGNDSVVIVFKAKVQADSTRNSSLDFRYVVRGNDYRIGYDIVFNNLKGIVTDQGSVEMGWNSDLRVQEKDGKVEVKNSSIYYHLKDEVDYLKENGSDDKKEENGIPINWVSYKQQFFSTALIASNNPFTSATMQTVAET
ncbi:MAG TPA: hypothetical protein DD434_13700, partial [Bacteroidales bacterium]|nr:hypothetical protein [Bacteroidales bacterium]